MPPHQHNRSRVFIHWGLITKVCTIIGAVSALILAEPIAWPMIKAGMDAGDNFTYLKNRGDARDLKDAVRDARLTQMDLRLLQIEDNQKQLATFLGMPQPLSASNFVMPFNSSAPLTPTPVTAVSVKDEQTLTGSAAIAGNSTTQ